MLSEFELLQKYDVPGPRYTSYPTVPAWREDLPVSSYADSLGKIRADDPLSLYFHLPFCENLCHFCGCFKIITKDHSRSRPYIETLKREVRLVSQYLKNSNKRVSQLHLGGGTPNFIQPDELAELMQVVRGEFSILPEAEIAVEMHPRTSTPEFCEELKKQKFNRISLGVQSFDDHVQKLINRHQTFEQTSKMVDLLRDLGFSAFNFDLIYGLPGDDQEKFSQTLQQTLTLKPDRLAVYSYAHVPWKSKVQRSFRDEDLPTPEQKLKMFAVALEFFTRRGYKQVGLDHFARETDELFVAMQNKSLHRNFMGYSTRADAHQIGFGISSISYVAGNYYQNVKDIEVYSQKILADTLCDYRGYELSAEDHIRRDLITGLMCHLHIDIPSFENSHKIVFKTHFANELKNLENFCSDGLVILDANQIHITERGKLALRNVAMLFDAYLDDVRKNSVNPVFSRTV